MNIDLTKLNLSDPFTLVVLLSLLALALMIFVVVDFVISMHKSRKKNSEPSTPPTPSTPIIPQVPNIPSIDPNKREINLIVKLPDLPSELVIPFEKLPQLLSIVNTNQKPVEENVKDENPQQGMDRRAQALISKVSGLEFSADGSKVYCNRHGWTDYIITEDGRIICKTGSETLFDPHKPSKIDIDVKKLSKELKEALKGINELQNKALITPVVEETSELNGEKENPEELEVEEEIEDSEGGENE